MWPMFGTHCSPNRRVSGVLQPPIRLPVLWTFNQGWFVRFDGVDVGDFSMNALLGETQRGRTDSHTNDRRRMVKSDPDTIRWFPQFKGRLRSMNGPLDGQNGGRLARGALRWPVSHARFVHNRPETTVMLGNIFIIPMFEAAPSSPVSIRHVTHKSSRFSRSTRCFGGFGRRPAQSKNSQRFR